jgi:hypothetical protein
MSVHVSSYMESTVENTAEGYTPLLVQCIHDMGFGAGMLLYTHFVRCNPSCTLEGSSCVASNAYSDMHTPFLQTRVQVRTLDQITMMVHMYLPRPKQSRSAGDISIGWRLPMLSKLRSTTTNVGRGNPQSPSKLELRLFAAQGMFIRG